MEVRFLRDYRGKLTAEIFYPAGASVSLPNGEALHLIADGVCVAIVAQESPVKGKSRGKSK